MTTADGIPATESGRHPLQTVESTCLIPAKSTGVASLCIQFAIMAVSTLVAIFFFYHVGGYEYMGWNENGTILDPIERSVLQPAPEAFILKNDSYPEANDLDYEDRGNSTDYEDTSLANTTIYIGGIVDAELDLLELIRISTLVYVGLCFIWLFSLFLLLLSIKYEVLDFVAINAAVLTVGIMYAFVHALFVSILLYYQYTLERQISWRTLAIVIGTIVILVLTTAIGALCLTLVVSWYKYIIYVNDGERCLCLAGITRLIKGSRRNRGPHEYAMPEATRHANIPYVDESQPPIQQFSHF